MKIARKIRGFTLLEMLIVIAIIVSLGVLGFQGLQGGRLRANQVISASNLRQLAAANLLYASDFQTYCPAGEPKNRIRWHGGRTGTSGPFDPEKGFLAEYLGLSRRVGICPEFSRHLTGDASWENGSGGYGYNATYIGGMPGASFKPNRPANVGNPNRTLMFATTAFAKGDGIQEYPFAEPRQSVNPRWETVGALQPSVHFRFNRRALIAWCDGHVTEEISSSDKGTNFYGGDNETANIGFCGPKENNGWWNPRN
jgi:prepilin-type N-terminal cleavage/methylation domain-containing protein/prepilin-type processing-associated H-X9-DG protein